MAIHEFQEGKTLPAEWFQPKAIRDAAWLKPLAVRLVKARCGPYRHPGAGDSTGTSASHQSSPSAGQETLYDVSCEVFDALEGKKRNPGFLDAGELESWVLGLRDVSVDEPGWSSDEEWAEKLSVLLLRRLEEFRFSVEFELADQFKAHEFQYLAPLTLGGPQELTLSPKLRDGRFRGWVLEGVVYAGAVGWAIQRLELLIDELCGAFRAVGLANLVPLPGQWFAEGKQPLGWPEATFVGGEWAGEALRIDPGHARRLRGLVLTIPEDLDDLGRQLLNRGSVGEALDPQQRLLVRLFGDGSEFAAQLRGACRRMVQAELSKDYGLSVTLAFSALEGLLLEPTSKEEVLGRLSEAVAHAIGRSPEHRSHLRKRVKVLYDARSKFVHTGTARQASSDRDEVIALGYRILRGEMAHLQNGVEAPAAAAP